MAKPKDTLEYGRPRVRKNMDMDSSKLAAAQRVLGTRTETETEDLVRPHATRERVVVPSFEASMHAGRVLAALVEKDRSSAAYTSALTNDAIIAASCREADVVLVSENTRDFTAIKRQLRGFRFVDSVALSS